MINSTSHQSWLFYSPLARQAALLKDDLLDPVDSALGGSRFARLGPPMSWRHAAVRTGRPTIAPDRLLRCCVMKHLKGWSFRDLERELRSNLVVPALHPLRMPKPHPISLPSVEPSHC